MPNIVIDLRVADETDEEVFRMPDGGPVLVRRRALSMYGEDDARHLVGRGLLHAVMRYDATTDEYQYVGYEVFRGKLENRLGSIVLKHAARVLYVAAFRSIQGEYTIVPGSGTEQLTDITGAGNYSLTDRLGGGSLEYKFA